MVKLIARLDAKPGQEALLAEALSELSAPSRAEAGCIQYDVCRSKEDAGKLLVLEEWETQEALDEHMETPHFKAFLEKAADALAGEPGIEFVERL